MPFFPLGSGFARDNPVLGSKQVLSTAERLGHTPAQIALAWILGLAPNVLLIPGTSTMRHLDENLAAAGITLERTPASSSQPPPTNRCPAGLYRPWHAAGSRSPAVRPWGQAALPGVIIMGAAAGP